MLSALPAEIRALGWNMAMGRPRRADRKFESPVIESVISKLRAEIADPVLGRMFERCFPNTLDTTVFPATFGGHPDTFVITGDIDAMWLRDSSAQVWPYLPYARQDRRLASLIEGLVRRQARMILLDSYANAFTRTTSDPPLPWAVHDQTEMKPGVAERKWEVDSLCYTIRLAHGYWRETGDTAPFNAEWTAAAWRILQTFREQQRMNGPGPYSFMRKTEAATDTLPLHGYGNPARPVGMIFSMFRPSDDACVFPLFVPANLFAMRTLDRISELASKVIKDEKLAAASIDLQGHVSHAVTQHGKVKHPDFGEIWAYEVDGYGNALMMDDANAPGLLSLAYLECCTTDDPLYQRTRRFVLSSANPYFFKGTAAEGVGGPHIGMGQIWPISIILRAMTSTDDGEIGMCLKWLRNTTAGTEFMHESFDENDPRKFTRSWFAWANTLFGELILKLAATRPWLLKESYGLPRTQGASDSGRPQ
ncbi:MAG TPA: glycoside hydrolase family 125 protein [Terracidiphilus sp.]|nr:glycoside hydrolase family 125 protein [Terracidiphilus sp.]